MALNSEFTTGFLLETNINKEKKSIDKYTPELKKNDADVFLE